MHFCLFNWKFCPNQVVKHPFLLQVIAGEDREAVGQLISIENQEGVVKFGTDDIKIMQLRHLCKMSSA